MEVAGFLKYVVEGTRGIFCSTGGVGSRDRTFALPTLPAVRLDDCVGRIRCSDLPVVVANMDGGLEDCCSLGVRYSGAIDVLMVADDGSSCGCVICEANFSFGLR